MLFEDCPTTKATNDFWKREIEIRFPILEERRGEKFLSLKKYITDSPQRFYSEEIFKSFLDYIFQLKEQKPEILISALQSINEDIGLALDTLEKINSRPIHDIHPPEDYNYKARFIQNEVHYNYLSLSESVYHKFIKIISYSNRLIRKKPVDGLDLFNSWEELKLTDFKFCTSVFNNTIRNGIGHGGVYFKERNVIYKGKKGRPHEARINEVIENFDGMLDICNALALAYKIFIIVERDFVLSNKIVYPVSFSVEELKAQANAPGWEIIDCMENMVIGDRKQMNIFVHSTIKRYSEVNYFMFRSAILTEFFARGFDRYFYTLRTDYGSPGWAAYKGEVLKKLREKGSENIVEYAKALEGNLIFFLPKYKLPKFLGTILSFVRIFKENFKLHYHIRTNFRFLRSFMVRDVQIHRRKLSVVINDASIVVRPEFQPNTVNLVRKEYIKMIKHSARKSKRELKFPLSFLLPAQYIRITVYDRDFRVRKLRGSGLIDSLVCSIEVNKSKTIKTIDFFGGIVEQHGKYRIVWNSNWKGISEIKSNL